MATEARKIVVRYSSVDRFSKTSRFKTLAGAQKFAQKYVGAHPDMGSYYAVSFDGIGKVEVEGATLAELFPAEGAAEVTGPVDPDACKNPQYDPEGDGDGPMPCGRCAICQANIRAAQAQLDAERVARQAKTDDDDICF